MDFVAELSGRFQERLQDGFQLEDITKTLEDGAKLVVQYGFDQLPDLSGQDKLTYCLNTLKTAWRTLVGQARTLFVAAVGAWAGFAFDIVRGAVEQWGEAQIDEHLTRWLKALIEWAYSVEYTQRNAGLALA